MTRGDKRQREYQANNPEPIQKPISHARQQRLGLENLTHEGLKSLVDDKCMDSNIYYRENIEASKSEFNYDGFESSHGLKLDFTDANSGKEHYFGFELVNNNTIKIHYAVVRSDGLNFQNNTKHIDPKKFSVRKLLDMVGEFK